MDLIQLSIEHFKWLTANKNVRNVCLINTTAHTHNSNTQTDTELINNIVRML